jgi:hypothetical protein
MYYINELGIEVQWTEQELSLLSHIRDNIGHYCLDVYYISWIHNALQHENPIHYLNDHLSEIAINAIATDSAYRI